MKIFDKKKLSKFHGRDGAPALIAYQGKVYDVTDSYFWLNGIHWVSHRAGQDLTDEMKDAPHLDDLLLEKFPVVGLYQNE